jgi:hypothetical protein
MLFHGGESPSKRSDVITLTIGLDPHDAVPQHLLVFRGTRAFLRERVVFANPGFLNPLAGGYQKQDRQQYAK